jgi:hypothetical protein
VSAGTLTGAAARFDRGLRDVGDGCWAWLQRNGAWGEANAAPLARARLFAQLGALRDELPAR